jgi:trehalose 6-phosphate synthase/phosphatase
VLSFPHGHALIARGGDPGGSAPGGPGLFLLLDYDGTLVPFAPTPDLAEPDDKLILLLQELAARPLTEVHMVSGRSRETLERWLGALPTARSTG